MLNPPQPNQIPKRIYNPLSTDFSFKYANENGKGQTDYVLKSQQITTLPTWLADKILKQLADQVYWKRYPDGSKAYIDEVIKIKKELEVNL